MEQSGSAIPGLQETKKKRNRLGVLVMIIIKYNFYPKLLKIYITSFLMI